MSETLEARDVRSLLRLLAELREMGSEPKAWRAHLATNLEALCGASVVVVGELRENEGVASQGVVTCADVVTSLQSIDHGLDASSRDRFYRDIYFIDHAKDDALGAVVPLYGSPFTVARGDLLDDRAWDRSFSANERFRAMGYDDFILSMAPVGALDVLCSLGIFRAPGKRFTARERLIVSLVHEELSTDWNRRSGTTRLTPRQREVLGRLEKGESEKEITYALGLSAHTTHDHVKAIYRAFRVRSRAELLALLATREPPRTRLVAESA